MRKCAVFCCLGLGDGLISLVLSKNLKINEIEVDTYHPSLSQMQEWFPQLPILPFSDLESLKNYDHFFIFYENSSSMRKILEECESKYPDHTTVLNPIATTRTNYPYWSGGKFDGRHTFVDNLLQFCQRELSFPRYTKSNGIQPLSSCRPFHFSKRVILHPTSTKENKNWPKEKYLELSERLKKEGWDPQFVVSPKEKGDWELDNVHTFPSLSDLAAFVCESGAMIGNDSGIGHLASCLNLPTLSIFPNAARARFWRPGWGKGGIVTPSSLIPNIKGLRLRDRHWKRWVTVGKVYRQFSSL